MSHVQAMLSKLHHFPSIAKAPGRSEAVTSRSGSTTIVCPARKRCAPSPIEQLFAKLKHHLRDAAERTFDTLCDAIGKILPDISADECRNYLLKAGYGQLNLIKLYKALLA